MIEDVQVIESLKTWGEMFEISRVKTFRGYRGDSEVTVTCCEDLTTDNSMIRFWARAIDQAGRVAKGNPGSTIDEAIRNLHWRELNIPE